MSKPWSFLFGGFLILSVGGTILWNSQQANAGQARPGQADPVLAALGFDPMSLDALVARTGMSAAELSARLLDLELAGRVARLPGQVFQRVERG